MLKTCILKKDTNINSAGVFFEYPESNSSEQKEETNLENLLRTPEKWPGGAVSPAVSAADSNELPKLKDGRSYSAEALPEFMDDIWVPWTKNHSDPFMPGNEVEGKVFLVYKDKRNNLYGIADGEGNVLIDAVCPAILDHRNRGRLQNLEGLYSYLICTDAPENYTKYGYINLEKNLIEWDDEKGFSGRGCNYFLEANDGMIIIVTNTETYTPKYGYMDENKNIVLKSIYQGATNFDEGYATVRMSGRWQIIEKDGSVPFHRKDWKTVQQLKGKTFIDSQINEPSLK